jgi:ubiquinone/menaquinone biosynthesis C-methylase UbiE
MPVRTNFFERLAFYNLNAVPSTMLDLAGLLAYQALASAHELGIFTALTGGASSVPELAAQLQVQERGLVALLDALEALGYVEVRDGRYRNSTMTQKWLLGDQDFDADALLLFWNAASRDFSPHMAEVIRSGERPFDFYEWVEAKPERSAAYQRMLMMNANMGGADVIKHLDLPDGATRLLDVGGGHGTYTVLMCQKYPQLQGAILDDFAGLETGRNLVQENELQERITLQKGDMFASDWGKNYDMILLFNVLHQFDLEAGTELLNKAYHALKPGGQVAILDQITGKISGSATKALIRLVALQYFLFADGRVFSREELGGMACSAGFADIRFHNLQRLPGNALVLATRV